MRLYASRPSADDDYFHIEDPHSMAIGLHSDWRFGARKENAKHNWMIGLTVCSESSTYTVIQDGYNPNNTNDFLFKPSRIPTQISINNARISPSLGIIFHPKERLSLQFFTQLDIRSASSARAKPWSQYALEDDIYTRVNILFPGGATTSFSVGMKLEYHINKRHSILAGAFVTPGDFFWHQIQLKQQVYSESYFLDAHINSGLFQSLSLAYQYSFK